MHRFSWALVFAVVGALIYFLYLENVLLQVTEYEVKCHRLPHGFDGFKIALVSELHGSVFGKEQGKLIGAVNEFEPT